MAAIILSAGFGILIAPLPTYAYPPDVTVQPDDGSSVLPSSGENPTAETIPAPTGTLPQTGGSIDSALVLMLGGGLVAVGGLTTLATRRRDASTPTA